MARVLRDAAAERKTSPTRANTKLGKAGGNRPTKNGTRAAKKQAAKAAPKGNGAQAYKSLEPGRAQIETFVNALFKYAGTDGYVSIRAFPDNSGTKPFRITAAALTGGLSFIVEVAVDDAYRAANCPQGVVFCPPIAVFANKERAREQDLLRGLVLSVECDVRAQTAREKLEQLLGPATVVVASGGEWTDPETGEVLPKLHLHWRLAKPVEDGATLADLKTARDIAARLVGGDPTNKSVVHPIRWPGSWHRKGEPKLCTIVAINPDREIDLVTALEVLRKEAPAASSKSNGKADASDPHLDGAPNWGKLIEGVLSAESYHEPLTRLAAKLITAGMDDGAAGNLLRGLMEASVGPHDERWRARYDDIDRCVSSAGEKYGYGDAEAWSNTDEPKQKSRSEQQKPSKAAIDPVDLWAQSKVPPLPKGLLPKVIENYAFMQGEVMGGDPAGLAMAALTVCAAIISDSVQLQPKKNDRGWLVSTRIWCALVGGVSAMKSPEMKKAMHPIEQIDAGLRRDFAKVKAEYDKLSGDEKKEAVEPVLKRIRVDDITPEAAQEVFKDNLHGVLLSRDELSGWFGTMDKYAGHRGAQADRSFWLSAYNGGPTPVDRVGRGSFLIENLSISILGGIQPDTARRVFADGIDDGLMQRINPIMLRNRVLGSEEEMTSPVDQHYDALIEQLFHQTHRVHFDDMPETFDAAAAAIRRQLEEKHLKLVQTYEVVNKKLAAHIGKYDGMFASMCLLWHTIEHHHEAWPANIDENTARRVARFLHEFLFRHAVAFYRNTFGLSDDHDRLTAVAGYILTHKLDRLTNRDIQRGVRSMRDCDHRDIESIFNQLDTFGWVTRVPGRKFTDTPSWVVNDAVHEKFAEQAEWEVDQRQQLQLLMAETVFDLEDSVTEIARHPSGYVLSAHPGKLKSPWLQLKLVRPGPIKKRLGESSRIWLQWNTETRKLNDLSSGKLTRESDEIQDWLSNILRGGLMH